MGAIGLNPIRLDRIGLDPIRINAIKLGVPGAASGTNRPYIDPEVLASLKAVCICYGKSNDDPDRAVVKNLVDPDNPFVISNAAYTEGSGYADKDSPYYGAFVTDGVNDLITSTKSATEMLDGSNEITVVSMMANLDSRQILCNSNYSNTNGYNVRNTLEPNGVISMLGYTDKNGTTNNINLIMGDKNSIKLVDKVNFNSDYVFYPAQYYKGYSQVAWYWTIIANKVLTTDQINQVIAYFNLDKYVKPDVYYDVKKQGITNDNHAQFSDKLIDYSGNSRDLQLFNIGWNLGSGIGKYAEDFSTMKDYGTKGIVRTSSKIYLDKSFDYDKGFWLCYTNSPSPAYKVIVSGIPETGMLTYTGGIWVNLVNGINELPARTNTEEDHGFVAQTPNVDWSKLVIEQIPDFAGALCLDGVNDFGKVTGMPIYKDYTFIIDREIISIGDTNGIVASKSEDSTDVNKQGAFLFEYLGSPNNVSAWSFYKNNGKVANTDFTRGISYQSKYSYNGIELLAGTAFDSDKLWLGTIRDKDSRFANVAIYSLMSFPYSMSKFLIERQLKKHKLGTLYPDMVEFRPIVKSNLPYSSISYSVNPGEYISVDSMVTITVTLPNTSDKLMEVSCNAISDISISGDNGVYEITGKIVKSPQKINLVISSYLTMLSNSTLISNETLIKNE